MDHKIDGQQVFMRIPLKFRHATQPETYLQSNHPDLQMTEPIITPQIIALPNQSELDVIYPV